MTEEGMCRSTYSEDVTKSKYSVILLVNWSMRKTTAMGRMAFFDDAASIPTASIA